MQAMLPEATQHDEGIGAPETVTEQPGGNSHPDIKPDPDADLAAGPSSSRLLGRPASSQNVIQDFTVRILSQAGSATLVVLCCRTLPRSLSILQMAIVVVYPKMQKIWRAAMFPPSPGLPNNLLLVS